MTRKTLLLMALMAMPLMLGGCALCHGHEGSDGGSMQKYWDHSNMRW